MENVADIKDAKEQRRDELSKVLITLAATVTQRMRMKIALDNFWSLGNVNEYFRGEVKDFLKAEKIINDVEVLMDDKSFVR